jgi:preprotein translocase subunit SecG
MSILTNIVLVVFIAVALLMVLIILMQRPKSEGLGAAFGGGMTDNLFGAHTTHVLTKFTAWLAGLFFVLTFLLSILYAKRGGGSAEVRQELLRTPAGAAAPGATPALPPAPGAPGDADAPRAPAPLAPAGDAAAALAPAPAETSPENLPQVEGGNPPTPADQAVGAVRQIPPPGNPIGNPPATPAPSP